MYRGIREGKEGDLEFEINIFSISGQVSGVKSNQLIFWLWQYFKGFLELLILDFTPETSILPNLHIVQCSAPQFTPHAIDYFSFDQLRYCHIPKHVEFLPPPHVERRFWVDGVGGGSCHCWCRPADSITHCHQLWAAKLISADDMRRAQKTNKQNQLCKVTRKKLSSKVSKYQLHINMKTCVYSKTPQQCHV